MKDLTVIMMTPNKVPKKWAKYHKEMLLKAIGDTPLITISNEPLDWGTNLIQTEYSVTNLYKQLLRGAKLAKTPYIAVADDDTLYSEEHFAFRPPLDSFAYNFNRWHIFTWGDPYYFHKPRAGGGLMIAPRELVVNAIEARLKFKGELVNSLAKELGSNKYAEKYDKGMLVKFYTHVPVISFYHDYSIDPLNQTHKKRPWPVKAFDLPGWGRAEDLKKKFE